jgi:hypothetical protein
MIGKACIAEQFSKQVIHDATRNESFGLYKSEKPTPLYLRG